MINILSQDNDKELQELINLSVIFTLFQDSDNFKTLLKGFGMEITSFVEDGHVNFDKLA